MKKYKVLQKTYFYYHMEDSMWSLFHTVGFWCHMEYFRIHRSISIVMWSTTCGHYSMPYGEQRFSKWEQSWKLDIVVDKEGLPVQRGDGLHAHDDVLYLDECHDHPNLPHLCFSDHLTCHSKKENKIYILRHPPVSTYIIRIYCQNPTLAPIQFNLGWG